jgi:hypothetical protein
MGCRGRTTVGVGARRGRRSAAGAHRRLGRALNAPTTCGARGRGASPNSLRALRALRSDSGDENVDEVRCAHRPGRCAPRRAAKSPPPGCACRDALKWREAVLTFGARAGQRCRCSGGVAQKICQQARSSERTCVQRSREFPMANGRSCPRSTLRVPEARRPRRVGARCGAPVGRRGAQGLRPSAKRVRKHFHRACLSGAPAGRAASCAMGPQDRAPTGSRRVWSPRSAPRRPARARPPPPSASATRSTASARRPSSACASPRSGRCSA